MENLLFQQNGLKILFGIVSNDTLQLWSKDNTRYYKGSFDSEGRKQGYWRWNYSTGTIQAEGYFKNDSLIGTLKMYNYQGQIIGTVFSSNEQLP